jgi:NAD(P)-dependent dehydrogenase (short-subunit alcohol dehydrogenase family)
MKLGLKDKVCVVAGGSGGIGKAVAKTLACEGAITIIIGRNGGRLDDARKEIEQTTFTSKTYVWIVDVTDEYAVMKFGEMLSNLHPEIHGLVNCAFEPGGHYGQLTNPRMEGIDSAAFISDMDTKILGTMRMIRSLKILMPARSRIVNVGGMSVRRTGSTIGSMRNAALTALTKNLADEFSGDGIAVNCVHPGVTVTERWDEKVSKQTPTGKVGAVGRFITGEEVADAITFLLSPKSIAINGESIDVGGGLLGAIRY